MAVLTRSCISIPLIGILLSSVSLFADSLKIGVVPFPEHGHINPMLSILSEALDRGHSVEVYSLSFAEERFFSQMKKRAGDSSTSKFSFKSFGGSLGPVTGYTSTGEEISSLISSWYAKTLITTPAKESFPILEDKLNEVFLAPMLVELNKIVDELSPEDRPDVMLVDHGAHFATAVAEFYKIPVVTFWPLVLQIPGQLNPAFPALSTGYSMNMSTAREWINNYITQRLMLRRMSQQQEWNNIQRQAVLGQGAHLQESPDELFAKYPVITPSVFGLDMAQPLCPNVFPVGFLQQQQNSPASRKRSAGTQAQRQQEEEDTGDDDDPLKNWMESSACEDGVIFYNFGTVAWLSLEMTEAIAAAISVMVDEVNPCHLWKLPRRAEQSTILRTVMKKSVGDGKVKVVEWLPKTPKESIFSSPRLKVFVTHCGSSGVYEALDSLVPMVGIPLFADQADMCARVADAGFGEIIPDGKLSLQPQQLVSAITSVLEAREAIQQKMKPVRALGHALGGAKRAVDILEMSFYPWFTESVQCGNQAPARRLSWIQKNDFDVLFLTGFLLLLPGISIWSCCCRGYIGATKRAKIKKD